MTVESLIGAIETAFRYKYFDFKTRTSVAHLWYVILFDVALLTPAVILSLEHPRQGVILVAIDVAALACPTLAAIVRRYHDVGLSGKSAIKLLCALLLCVLITVSLYEETITFDGSANYYVFVLSATCIAAIGLWLFFTLSLPTYPGETKWNAADETYCHLTQEEAHK